MEYYPTNNRQDQKETEMIDTLKHFERLEKAGFSKEKAQAITHCLLEHDEFLSSTIEDKQLATKDDIKSVKTYIKLQIKNSEIKILILILTGFISLAALIKF